MAEDTQLTVIFPDLEQHLSRANAAMQAAESHGLLCARYCLESAPAFAHWLEEVLGDESDATDLEACEKAMHRVYGLTQEDFDNNLQQVGLLLPADRQPLAIRSRALADWCSGFVGGLGLGGLRVDDDLQPEVQEILRDLIEITQLEDHIDEGEENELAYMEIVEYVRIAVMTIGLSLRQPSSDATLH